MLRYRTRGSHINTLSNYQTIDGTCATPGVSNLIVNSKQGMFGHLETMSDIVTPDFKARSKRGDIVNTFMEYTSNVQKCSGSNHILRSINESCVATHTHAIEDASQGTFIYWAGVSLPPGNWRGLDVVSLIDAADIQAAVKVAATQAWQNASQHSADILTDLAESRETVGMLTNPTSSFKSLTNAINSGSKKGGKLGKGLKVVSGAARTSGDLWLQYRYGVRPLVKSVQGVLEALSVTKASERHTYRGSYTLYKSATTSGVKSWNGADHSWTQVSTDKVIIRSGLLFQEQVLPQSTALGLTGSGMLSVPWEVIPLSFVADWFVDVGSFLQGFAASFHKFPIAEWHSIRREQTVTWNVTGTALPVGTIYTLVKPATEVRYVSQIKKTRYPNLPGPSITLKPQSFEKVFSDLRGVDSFVLATQKFFKAVRG